MATISKIGNSRFCIRVPQAIALAAGWKVGSRVTVRNLNDGSVLVQSLDGGIAVTEDLTLVEVKASLPPVEKW